MNKLICMGDCIVDFLPSAPDELTYSAKMGGAPANVCVAVAKLGGKAFYLGKLAKDNFDRFLLGELTRYGVNTEYTALDGNCKTGLVVVDLYKNGERDFFFYRDMPADANLYPDEVKEEMFSSGDILHFCSISLLESPTKNAHKKAVQIARAKGCFVSFDVNVRMNLWQDEDKLRSTVFDFLPYADFVKVTDEELFLLTKINDEKEAVTDLLKIAENAKLIFITKGEKGSVVYDRSLNNVSVEAKSSVVIDTTGAGDCFIASIIFKLLTKEASLTIDGIIQAMRFASKACAIVISKKGAASAMPALSEIE